MSAEDIARQFHDTYERLAPAHGWETQERSRVEWDDLPAENRALMVAVVADVVGPILAGLGAARAEATRLREALVEVTDMRPCHWYGRYCTTHSEKRPCSHGDAQALLASSSPPTDQGLQS